jgi:hypothetical protein
MAESPETPEQHAAAVQAALTHEQQHHLNKDVQFYSAILNAWVTTRMEVDRQLLTMGIALLGGLAFAVTQLGLVAEWQFWLLGLSAASIAVSVFTLVRVLDKNADYLLAAANKTPDEQERAGELAGLDRVARRAFYVGVALAMVVVLQIGWVKTKQTEHDNVRREQTERQFPGGPGSRDSARQPPRDRGLDEFPERASREEPDQDQRAGPASGRLQPVQQPAGRTTRPYDCAAAVTATGQGR